MASTPLKGGCIAPDNNRRSLRHGYLYHYLPPFGKIVVHLFTTKQNKMASECIAVPNGNASGKFNLANDSVLFSV